MVIHKVASYSLFRFFVANKLGHFTRFVKYSDEIYGVWTFVQTRFSLDNRRTVSRVLCVLFVCIGISNYCLIRFTIMRV